MVLNPGLGWTSPARDAEAANVAALIVQSEPAGANVYVDGRLAGLTPLQVDRLSSGDHRVRLVKDGYLENARIVSVGSTPKNLNVTLTPHTGTGSDSSEQITGGGGGGSKKWLWIGAAAGGAVAAGLVLANRNHAPEAGSVLADPTGGLASSTAITFSAQGASDPDGDALTYSWDFGDSTSGSGERVTHTYTNAGTFNVTLTVNDGKKSATASGSVTIRNLTGAWNGTISSVPSYTFVMNLTQSGSTVAGTYSDRDGPGSVSGAVAQGSIVRLTITQLGISAQFTAQGTANAAVSSVSGTVVSGFQGTPSFTMTR
jgi:PKD repeat protein